MSKILILEDDPDILELLSERLEENGFDTIRASNCLDAKKYFDRCDGFLSDGQLPDGLGHELIKSFKNSFPEKPAVLFSGNKDILDNAAEEKITNLVLDKSAPNIEKNLESIISVFQSIVKNQAS